MSRGGLAVVDLRLEKMFLILSCSFLVLSLGVVSGVLTVVDLASPGRRVNNLPGGLPNSPERRGVAEAGEDSVVVMPGVSSRSMTVVPRGREETPDLVGVPARWLDGVVRSGGDLGGLRVERGMTKSPSFTVTGGSVTLGMRENNSCGDSEDVDKLMILSSLSSIAFSESSVGISFNKSTILGLNVDLFEFEMVEKEG